LASGGGSSHSFAFSHCPARADPEHEPWQHLKRARVREKEKRSKSQREKKSGWRQTKWRGSVGQRWTAFDNAALKKSHPQVDRIAASPHRPHRPQRSNAAEPTRRTSTAQRRPLFIQRLSFFPPHNQDNVCIQRHQDKQALSLSPSRDIKTSPIQGQPPKTTLTTLTTPATPPTPTPIISKSNNNTLQRQQQQ